MKSYSVHEHCQWNIGNVTNVPQRRCSNNSPPGGHDQSGLPVCTGYACVASVTLAVQSGLCRFSHPVRHAPPLGGALAARKARDDRFRLARDGIARHLGFWKLCKRMRAGNPPPTPPHRARVCPKGKAGRTGHFRSPRAAAGPVHARRRGSARGNGILRRQQESAAGGYAGRCRVVDCAGGQGNVLADTPRA